MADKLQLSLSALTGVGASLATKLKKIGLNTVRDLLFYFPYRFDDFSAVTPIAKLIPNETVTVQGQLKLLRNRRSFRRRLTVTEGLVADETGEVKVVWFNQPYLLQNLKVGEVVSLAGKTSDNILSLQLMSPAYEKVVANRDEIHTARLVPVYSLPKGVATKTFRSMMSQAVKVFTPTLEEWLPTKVLGQVEVMTLSEAVSQIHFPTNTEQWQKARMRFQFEEILLLQLVSLNMQNQLQQTPAPAIPFHQEMTEKFLAQLPFKLTDEQRQVSWEILQNISQPHPMNRLLEGDVGSGKTVVAAIAAINTAQAGGQVLIMAPTEILARQHYQSFTRWCEPLGLKVALKTSHDSQCLGLVSTDDGKVDKTKMLQAISRGEVPIIIGTHALVQDKIECQNLALAIVDEQHRFGVAQRKALRDKSGAEHFLPHLLSMTATPIPRTLTLTVYGDLQLSLLHEKPAGRKAIVTKIVPESYRDWTYDFIRKQVASGRQVFVICPNIDESDTLGVKSVKKESERLKKEVLSDLRVEMLHGKLKPDDKQKIMAQMVAGEIDILVTTSVIEVGVDVPNANIMMIEGAERFGLAQLHQFRGRV